MVKLFACGILALSFPFGAAAQATGTVVLQVQGILPKKGGELSCGLFSAANFPTVGRQTVGSAQRVTGATMTVTLANVPPGDYGVAVFQDIDANQDLNTNFVGLPTEPIGFSNGARIRLGPPAFADARVRVEAGKTLTLPITLR